MTEKNQGLYKYLSLYCLHENHIFSTRTLDNTCNELVKVKKNNKFSKLDLKSTTFFDQFFETCDPLLQALGQLIFSKLALLPVLWPISGLDLFNFLKITEVINLREQ